MSNGELTQAHKVYLLGMFPDMGERIYELEKHTRREMAEYIDKLAREVPPNEELPRYRIYRWALVGPEPYFQWSKKEQMRRILTLEMHDQCRLQNKPVPYTHGSPPPNPSEVDNADKNDNPVRTPSWDELLGGAHPDVEISNTSPVKPPKRKRKTAKKKGEVKE